MCFHASLFLESVHWVKETWVVWVPVEATARVWFARMMILQEELSGPGDTAPSVVSKAPIKMRQSKSQPASSAQNVMMSGGMLPQQLAVYQPTPVSLQPHQFMVHFKMHLIHCSTLVRCIFMKFKFWRFVTKSAYPEAVHIFLSLSCPSMFSSGKYRTLLAYILYRQSYTHAYVLSLSCYCCREQMVQWHIYSHRVSSTRWWPSKQLVPNRCSPCPLLL